MSNNTKIGLWAAVSIGVNAMIGAGVLAMPEVLANRVGPAGIFTCIISILMILFLGLSLGRAADVYPGDGWSYLYPSKWAGHTVGLISSFCYLFGVMIAMGFMVDFFGIWIYSFLPIFTPKILGVITLFLLTLLILAGTKISSLGQYLIAGFVVVPLLVTAAFTWLNFNVSLTVPFMPHGIQSVFKAIPVILFALLGFESIVSLYASVKNPKKNVPLAFVLSICIVGLLYMAFIYGILFSVPKQFFVGGLQEPLSNVLAKYFSSHKFLSISVLIGACFAMLGTLHSMIWSVGALFKSVVARTKLDHINNFFDLKAWNSDFAVVTTAAFVLLFSFTLKLDTLMIFPVFLIMLSYILSIASLLFKKAEWKSGRNIITLLGLLSGFVISYFALIKVFS